MVSYLYMVKYHNYLETFKSKNNIMGNAWYYQAFFVYLYKLTIKHGGNDEMY